MKHLADNMGRMRTVLLLAVASVLAGCASPAAEQDPDPDGATYRVAGAFTREFSPGDERDLGERLSPWYERILIMESFPAQYNLGGLGAGDCQEVRAILLTLDYVATVSECLVEEPAPDDPDGATSSS